MLGECRATRACRRLGRMGDGARWKDVAAALGCGRSLGQMHTSAVLEGVQDLYLTNAGSRISPRAISALKKPDYLST
eukprot:4161643-Pleurochrysis_carterae.AAC.1